MKAHVSSPHLVAREEELERLTELIGEVRSGRSSMVLLGGDAGVGKSRLVAEFIEGAEQDDAWALVGRCVDFGEGGVRFAPFAQVFTTVAHEVERTRLPELLGHARHELARVAPDLTERTPGDIDSDAGDRRGRLFGAVADALRALARAHGPLVVVLEDMHWAQASTLDLLRFLARNLDDEPLLLVATFRSDELHRRHPLRPVLGELARLPHVRRLQLEALDDEQVGELVAAILGEQPDVGVVQDIAERSAGNPFYVEELVAASREGGPDHLRPALRDVVAARLDRLPDPAREVLDVAAVAGSGVDDQLLAAVTDHDASDLASVLRPAVDRHVLRVEGDAYRFRHELVREVVNDDLLPGRRAELHRCIARIVEGRPELTPGGRQHADAVLAHHWYAARDLQRAFHASLRAAPKALEAAAHAEALEHDERALELWDQVDHDGAPERVGVLERAARSAHSAGRYQRAIAHLRSALEPADDLRHEADLRRRIALALWRGVGGHEAALTEAERAHQLVADMAPSPVKAQVVANLARLYMLGRDERTIPLASDALELAREIGDRVAESQALNTLGVGLAFSGEIEDAVDHLREALTIAREIGDTPATARAFNNLVVILTGMAPPDRDDRDAVTQSAMAWLLRHDHVDGGGVLAAVLIGDALRRGRWDRAERLLDWMAGSHMEGTDEAHFHKMRARLRWMQGRLEEAAADTERLHLVEHHEGQLASWAYALDAVLAAARGDLEDLRAAVASGCHVLSLGGHNQDRASMALRLHRPLVRAEVDAELASDQTGGEPLERATEALQTMERVLDDEKPVAPGDRHRAELYLHLAHAELSRAVEPDPDRWRAVLAHPPRPYWEVYSRWRLAESLLDVDRREEAVTELQAAHDQAVDLGAGLLQQEVEALARRAHVRVPGVEIVGADDLGLTPRQTQVLELVARGMTNREIGEALYITEKTASVHVSNILSKLAVDDRYEAADRAVELGLVDGEVG